MNDKTSGPIRFQPRREAVTVRDHRLPILSQIELSKSELSQHPVQQTGTDLVPAVFQHWSPSAETERAVTALAALLHEPDDNATLTAKLSEPAQQSFPVMIQVTMAFLSARRARIASRRSSG